jgi:hypothetical protein
MQRSIFPADSRSKGIRSPIIAFQFLWGKAAGQPTEDYQGLSLNTGSESSGSGKFTGIREKSLPLNLIFNNLQVDSGLLFYGGNAACSVRNALPIESFLDAAGRRGQPCFDEKVSVSQQRPIS